MPFAVRALFFDRGPEVEHLRANSRMSCLNEMVRQGSPRFTRLCDDLRCFFFLFFFFLSLPTGARQNLTKPFTRPTARHFSVFVRLRSSFHTCRAALEQDLDFFTFRHRTDLCRDPFLILLGSPSKASSRQIFASDFSCDC